MKCCEVCPASSLGWPNAWCEEFAQFDLCSHDNQMGIQAAFISKSKIYWTEIEIGVQFGTFAV